MNRRFGTALDDSINLDGVKKLYSVSIGIKDKRHYKITPYPQIMLRMPTYHMGYRIALMSEVQVLRPGPGPAP